MKEQDERPLIWAGAYYCRIWNSRAPFAGALRGSRGHLPHGPPLAIPSPASFNPRTAHAQLRSRFWQRWLWF